jgi:RsiW-degrading membrane proteinase PrsW (M82 family)
MDESQVPRENNTIGRWMWLKILISGIVMFYLIEYALRLTHNINYIPSLLIVGTFTVPLAFLVLFYSRNRIPQVSADSLLTSVLWGGVLGTVIAGLLEYQTLIHLSILPTFMIGFIEEAAKLAIPAILILGRKTHSRLDSIVIGAASGAGFAALESMGYGLVALLATGGDLTFTTQVLLSRGLMAPAAHIAWTAIAADALWEARSSHAAGYFIFVFVGVVILHTLWDSIVIPEIIVYIVLGLISLVWLLVRVYKATHEQPVAWVQGP